MPWRLCDVTVMEPAIAHIIECADNEKNAVIFRRITPASVMC